MHSGLRHHPRYTGSGAHPFAPAVPFPAMHPHAPALQGFCPSCCHPKVKCVCGYRECRKEAKELLVQATLSRDDLQKDATRETLARMIAAMPIPGALAQQTKGGDNTEAARAAANSVAAIAQAELKLGLGTAFIGGGCCVHLSVEYTPSTPTANAIVAVLVQDSEGTSMAWFKTEKAGTGYQIKEGIITTKPGADLFVLVANMTARVRWCEIFSC